MLEDMFRQVAQPDEIELVDSLYNQGHKGSAVVVMTKKIYAVWQERIAPPRPHNGFKTYAVNSNFVELGHSIVHPFE